MPSRRSVLAALAAGGTVGGLGGCVSWLTPSRSGYVQLKGISLTWEYDGRTYVNEPLKLLFDPEEGTARGRQDPDYVGSTVGAPDDVVVPDPVAETLSAWFDVEYVVGVCGENFADGSYGCLNRQAGLTDFNRVQLTDRASIVNRDDRMDVVGISGDAYEVEDSRIRTFDFAKGHEDDGLPEIELPK